MQNKVKKTSKKNATDALVVRERPITGRNHFVVSAKGGMIYRGKRYQQGEKLTIATDEAAILENHNFITRG